MPQSEMFVAAAAMILLMIGVFRGESSARLVSALSILVARRGRRRYGLDVAGR